MKRKSKFKAGDRIQLNNHKKHIFEIIQVDTLRNFYEAKLIETEYERFYAKQGSLHMFDITGLDKAYKKIQFIDYNKFWTKFNE